MDGQTPEHYLEVLFNARALAAREVDEARRKIWLQVVQGIEMLFADHLSDVAAARERLALRDDEEARSMLAYLNVLARSYDDAENAARAAINRARNA